MIVEVAYGEIDAARFFDCGRCGGLGEAETYFQSGEFKSCPRCHGTGQEPHPRAYAYVAPDGVAVGDHVIAPATAYADEQIATVVRIGTTYDGPVKRVRVA